MKNKILVPVNAMLLLLLTFIWSCNKEKNVAPNSNTPASTYFMKGLLDGEEIVISGSPAAFKTITDVPHHEEEEDEEDDDDDNGEEEENRTIVSTGCNWTAADLAGGGITTGSVELRKLVVRIYISPITSQQVYTMLEPNSFNFSYDKNAHSGAYITLRDRQGVLWTSHGDQTGSTFVVTNRGEQQTDYATFAGTFTCKMYDGHGNMKQLTNGSFSATGGL